VRKPIDKEARLDPIPQTIDHTPQPIDHKLVAPPTD